MSYPPVSLPRMTFNPWRAIRRMSDVTVVWQRRPGILGSWCEQTRTLTLDPDQNQAERRCTVAHEQIHAERGDTDCHPRVHREAARRLIDIHALAEAAVFYGDDLAQVAEQLWVDGETLRARLDHLHPSERGYLQRRLAMKENSA